MRICKISAALVAFALFVASPLAAYTFISDPIGQIKLTVSGTNGIGSSAITVLGAPLENKIEVAGSLTAVSGTTLTSSSATWTPDAFAVTHYLQITSGNKKGIAATIVSSAVTELTPSEDLSSLLNGNESFAVRAYTTIADLFGAANESGLGSGPNLDAADEILIYNGTTFDFYYYQVGAAFGGTGWRTQTNAFTDQSGSPLPIGTVIIVKRKQVDDLDVFFDGNVLTTNSVVPIESGANWISGSHPIEYTLTSYFGESGGNLLKGATSELADEILVPKEGGGFHIYYYQEGAAFGGVGYRSATNAFSDASNTIIAKVGKGFVLKRKGAAYNQTDRTPLN